MSERLVSVTAMWTTLIAVAGTLAGAGLIGGLALWGQQLQWRREQRTAAADALVLGAEELIVRAGTLDVASHQAVSMAGSFASLGGQVNRLLGIVSPVDLHAVLAPMHVQYEGLTRAAARIQLTQDDVLVRLAHIVVEQATEVIEAHNEGLPRSPLLRVVRYILRRPLGNERRVADTRANLGEATRALIDEVQRRGGSVRT